MGLCYVEQRPNGSGVGVPRWRLGLPTDHARKGSERCIETDLSYNGYGQRRKKPAAKGKLKGPGVLVQ